MDPPPALRVRRGGGRRRTGRRWSRRCARSGRPPAIRGRCGSRRCSPCGCPGPVAASGCVPPWKRSCSPSARGRSTAGWRPTGGRPYKKDDNAHIEQKNWTHVRKLFGYVRYDTPAACTAMHALYAHELRLFQNLFLPSVKLARKERVGSRLRRRYDAPCTPFERVLAGADLRPEIVAQLRRYREGLDPFALARAIDQQLERIHALASLRHGAPVDPAQSAGPCA